jgi:NhaA family Na+:H+ antiporter
VAVPDPIGHSHGHDRDRLWRTGPIWIASDRHLARFVGRPVAKFMRVEAAGGIVLFVATIAALVWANSAWSGGYETLWTTEVELRIGSFDLVEDLRHWVNDGVMMLFFLVVGLEIKYEITSGELRDPRAALVPIVAAVGGMVVPAVIYAGLNSGGEGAAGWGVPMATDIAFALGVVALLGRRIPASARLFLLTLAIVDDVGAIAVIGIFYTRDLSVGWSGAALAGVAAILVLRRLRVWSFYPYLLAGGFVWLATYLSGIHATIAGVVLGLLTPAKPLLDEEEARRFAGQSAPAELDAGAVRRFRFLLGESIPVAERLEHALHPWTSYVVLPVFALANAGIDLRGGVIGEAVSSPVTTGVAFGLVAGKTLGVLAAAWLAVRLGSGRLPEGTNWGMLSGLAALAGIGFTVSLFISGLAFPGAAQAEADAKVGILAGSVAAALLGATILLISSRRSAEPTGAPAVATASRQG